MALYGFTLDHGPDGWRYVKQRHEQTEPSLPAETVELPASVQSAYRFATYQEAVDAGEEWARRANGESQTHSTYRERREARADRLRGWADKRTTEAHAALNSDPELRHDWAFITQPGRIPARDRMNRSDERAFRSLDKADAMRERAAGIEHQNDRAIYSDDPDAPERLAERIAELEAERDRIKAYNAAVRKAGQVTPEATANLDERQRAELASLAKVAAWQLGKHGEMPGYLLSNLGGNIKRLRDRLSIVQARQKRADEAAASPNGVTMQTRGEYCRVTFADKPNRAILDALKAAGFWWRSGSWQGRRDALPATVSALVEE